MSMSRLDDINPEDIASIEVIKGPAAATLYGTEAANGVIQIITKRGTEGEPTFDASVELGANWMRDPYSETKSYTNWGYSTTGELLSMNMLRAYEERHGGQSLLQYGPIQKYSLSVAGGTPQFRYFASANHIDQEGIVDWNSDKRSTGRLSLSITPSDRLDITLNTSVMTGETKEPGTFWGQTMRGSPRTAADHGGVENRLNGWGSFAPDEYREFQDDRTGVERSNITLQVSFNPVDWLQNRLTVGRDLSDEWTWNLDLREPEPALSFFGDGLGGKSIAEVETKLITFDYSGTATFDLTQQLGSATSIGLQYYGKEQWSRSASGDEFATAALTTVGATAVQDGSEDLIENVTLGFYVQEQFDWEDRIFVTGAVRFDDNSAFGRNFDAAVYPKVSATWVLSEESFWDFDLVNMFRARAAWGQAGQQPDVFDAQRLYEAVPGTGNIPFLTPTSFGNEDLGPEKSDELEVGFDTGLWNDRVEVAFTYYTKRTTDAIVDRAVAPSFGIPGRQLINVGKVVNWGSELLLDVDVLTGNPLQWNMRFSFATMNNEIKNLGGAERIGVYRSRFHVEGYPLSSFFAEKVVSADLEFDEADVPDKTLFLAKSHAYAGYSYQLLGEAFCELTFDGGPSVTREATMRIAIDHFTTALDLANQLSSSEARSLGNMALVGRARAHLNLGEGPQVVVYASQVDAGFFRNAEMSASDSRRYNPIYMGLPPQSRTYAVHPSYANLEVGGVPDPRVPLVDEGLGTGFDAVTHMWGQAKFSDRAAPIQFASWREAQLMIAEVEGGPTAVGIINTLRATVADLPWVDAGHPGLPQFASTDEAAISAEVWEERRRELLFQGTKLGDMLRVSIPGVVTDDFETGINQRGDPYNDAATCIPIMDQETLNNSNL